MRFVGLKVELRGLVEELRGYYVFVGCCRFIRIFVLRGYEGYMGIV